jgi:hypothetical protein
MPTSKLPWGPIGWWRLSPPISAALMWSRALNLRTRSMQELPPSRRRRAAKGLVIGVEVVQPAGFGARSSNVPDAGSRRTSSGRRNFARGGRPARPAQAVISAHRRKAHRAQTNCNVFGPQPWNPGRKRDNCLMERITSFDADHGCERHHYEHPAGARLRHYVRAQNGGAAAPLSRARAAGVADSHLPKGSWSDDTEAVAPRRKELP